MHNFFVAHSVTKKVRTEIKYVQQLMHGFIPEAKLANPDTCHITLSFFPQVNKSQLHKLKQIILDHRKELSQIRLHFDRIDAFPNLETARVLYIHLGGEIEKLRHTVESIRNKATCDGIVFDPKKFIPHLTIARLKKHTNLSALAEQIGIPKVEFSFGELWLYQSLLAGNGSLYLPVAG